MVRFGWISVDGIAANLSKWTTKEQRECGEQLLTIHAADLPPNTADVVKESRAYMAQIMSRLSPARFHSAKSSGWRLFASTSRSWRCPPRSASNVLPESRP